MRKIILTEAQLKKIMGEDFTSYLPNSLDQGAEPENSELTQIGTVGKIDGERGTAVTTDKIAKSRCPKYPVWRTTSGLAEEENLNEENQDLVNMGNTFNMGKNVNAMVSNVSNANPNDRMMKNIANDPNMNASTAYTRINRLKKMKVEDPARYVNIGGDKLLKTLQDKIEAAKKSSASKKQVKAASGMNNAYQKEGGTKQVGNGKAHTPKSSVSITY